MYFFYFLKMELGFFVVYVRYLEKQLSDSFREAPILWHRFIPLDIFINAFLLCVSLFMLFDKPLVLFTFIW